MKKRQFGRGIGSGAAWWVFVGVLVAGFLVTAWAYQLLADAERQRQEATLASTAEQTAGSILGQFARYETQLAAARALFAGSDFVSRSDWRAFAQAFQQDERQRGFFELAWLPEVDGEQLARLKLRVIEEGLGEMTLDPPGLREIYCPIFYVEPWEIHADHLGLDACARENTLPAMIQARATGSARLSNPVSLVSEETDPVRGYVLFVWVEDAGGNLPGWVLGTIPFDFVFQVLPDYRTDLHMIVTDHTDPDAPEHIHDGNEHVAKAADSMVVERQLKLGGRELTLQFHQKPVLGPGPWLLLAAGFVITLLVAGFVHVLIRNRARALALADRMSRAYRESEQMLSSITNNILEGIYRGVPGENLVYVNQALVQMFRFDSAEEMIDHTGPILYAHPEQREELHRQLIEHGQYSNQEVEFIRQDGTRFTAINNCVAVRDDQGRLLHFDGVISDITERKRAEEEVHRLAHYDPLTGLPNRTLLNDRIRQAVRQAGRMQRSLTLMFMDLDRFKMINDSLGHGAGDLLLGAVARRLEQGVRSYDTISRLGGDEFVLVLPDTDANVAAAKASAILESFRKPFEIEGQELTVTPSIGIAMYPNDAVDAESLIRNADAAMYHAKERGRSTFQFFTAELNERAYERLTIENHLRNALDHDELSLVYQPQIRLSDNQMIGAEALLRWTNPTLGPVTPDRFIPVAEQSGLIVEIGDWVIDAVCKQLAEWRKAGIGAMSIAVNVSAVQFWRGNLVEVVRDALGRWEISPGDLDIELTESVIMQDAEAAREVLSELKTLGIGLVIDDFGTGYSSLSYLKQFQIDLIKIDRSFVNDVAVDADDAAIVSAILSMARDLRIRVVAEGVENQQQLEFMHSKGCQFAQGFLFDRPLEPEQFLARAKGSLKRQEQS